LSDDFPYKSQSHPRLRSLHDGGDITYHGLDDLGGALQAGLQPAKGAEVHRRWR